MINYNGAEYLSWCLEAIKGMDHEPAEIMVVDNASTDESVSIVRDRFPEVKLIELSDNKGPCPARNVGLSAAAHPLVFQLDCDIAPLPECLSILLDAMNSGGDRVAACQPRAVFDHDPGRIHYDGAWFHYVGTMSLINYYSATPSIPSMPSNVDAVISMALLLKKDEVLDAGGYDPRFFILFEDHDLSYRMRTKGFELLSVPGALVRHKEGTAGVSFREPAPYPPRRAFLQSRNRWIVLMKNHSLRTLVFTAPALLLFDAIWLIFSLREGFLLDFLKGKLSFFRVFPSLLAERRKNKAGRVLRDRDLLRADDLTFSPLIKKSRTEAFLERCLNLFFRSWWRLVRPLIG